VQVRSRPAQLPKGSLDGTEHSARIQEHGTTRWFWQAIPELPLRVSTEHAQTYNRGARSAAQVSERDLLGIENVQKYLHE
jgi:hypothetical protein